MIKKIWIGLSSLFVVCGFGFTFANPIVMDMPDVCYKLKNVEIDNYKLIISTKSPQKEDSSMNKNLSNNKSVYDSVLDSSTNTDLLKNDRGVWRFYLPKMNECIQQFQNSDNRFSRNLSVALLDNSIDVDTLTEEEFNDNAIYVGTIGISDCLHDYDCDVINTYKIINSGYNYSIVLDKRENVEWKHNISGKASKFPLFWGLAVLIETLLLFFIAKIFRKEDQISNKKLLLRGVIPTTITLPLLRFVLPLIIGDGTWYVIIGETLVTIVEAVMIKYGLNISRKKAIICSIICNLFSFIMLSFNIFGGDIYTKISIIALLLFILVEGILLFIVGRLSREGISNKKLVLCGFLIPIIDIIVALFIARLFDGYLDIFEGCVIIIIKVLVDILIIRFLRKISRGKTIIASVFFNACIAAIILALIYFLD